jgi:3,4-dihydroxy 2-butanone 4-phosphate synthase / GTP cyclohydrolase II
VICEIMNDDGSMARMPDLERFAEEHDLKILTIADLIQYRLQTETLVERIEEREIVLDQTGTRWRAVAFEVLVENRPAFALVKGDVTVDEPILCRVHSGSTLGDLFCSSGGGGGKVLRAAIDRIEAEGRGVLLYLASTRTLADELAALPVGPRGVPAPAESHAGLADGRTGGPGARQILRRFGLGAQMLSSLGVHKLRLLTNTPLRIAGLTGYGLEVVERVGLDVD